MGLNRVSWKIEGSFFITVLILATTILLFSPASVQADADMETVDFETEGVGIVGQQSLSQARDRAVENALANALKEAIRLVLPPGSSPGRYGDAWRHIAKQKNDYIQKYGVLAESHTQSDYQVRISATLFVGIMADRLRALGFETARHAESEKRITLTVHDVRSYEEYVHLQDYLKRGLPCVQKVIPARFAWREVSFRLTIMGPSDCVTSLDLPFDVQAVMGDEITGSIRR